ncbi:MAG TPA: hypothetical protein VF855_13885 [Acidimicrobiales bacterium]
MRGARLLHGVLVAGLAVGVLAASGCGGSDEPMSLDQALRTPISDRRDAVRSVLGPPEAFKITFGEVNGQTVRYEAWSYPSLAARVDFVDGMVAWTATIEELPDGSLAPLQYGPEEFAAGMTPAQLHEALAGVELKDIDLGEVEPGLSAVVGGQLLAGFSDGRLVYVETFALVPDPGGELAAFVEEASS